MDFHKITRAIELYKSLEVVMSDTSMFLEKVKALEPELQRLKAEAEVVLAKIKEL